MHHGEVLRSIYLSIEPPIKVPCVLIAPQQCVSVRRGGFIPSNRFLVVHVVPFLFGSPRPSLQTRVLFIPFLSYLLSSYLLITANRSK